MTYIFSSMVGGELKRVLDLLSISNIKATVLRGARALKNRAKMNVLAPQHTNWKLEVLCCIKEDRKVWKMTCVNPIDRVLWRKNLKDNHIAVQPP